MRKRRNQSLILLRITFLVVALSFLFTTIASAAKIPFSQCRDKSYDPDLRFVPSIVDAKFSEDTNHQLSVSIYGNITKGLEIVDQADLKYTTLKPSIDVLSYTVYSEYLRFCNYTTQPCPLQPVINGNLSDETNLPGFTVTHPMLTSYAFSSFSSEFIVLSTDTPPRRIACVRANITPALGSSLSMLLIYAPLTILLLSGVATALAAIFNPWTGTKDVFAWSSNFGRDDDMLRLVTPGFADCLQYIQFIYLTGSLSLNYPGFFRPVVAKAAWSMLLFNISLVSGQSESRLIDNIYTNNATYGLESLTQLTGIGKANDIWAAFMVVFGGILASIVAAMIVLAFMRWTLKRMHLVESEDLRSKNLPFLGGILIRVIFNYLFLPIFVFSAFQLLIAGRTDYKLSLDVVAGIVLLLFVGGAALTVRRISACKPRARLYDDLPTLLLYGPLYNTYEESATLFCVIYTATNALRALTVGFVQPSGIGQLVLLSVSEVIMIVSLNAFRPYSSKTSMNLYHTTFSIIRFLAILFQIAFVPSLNIDDGAKGWIGYIILLLHGVVLIFGFFLNAIQTIVEVLARLAGVGDVEGGAARGGLGKVLGRRQLSRRSNRHDQSSSPANYHNGISMEDRKMSFIASSNRQPSLSGSSGILLNAGKVATPGTDYGFDMDSPNSVAHKHNSSSSTGIMSRSPRRVSDYSYFENAPSVGSYMGQNRSSAVLGAVGTEATPYYRPPRKTRNSNTNMLLTDPTNIGRSDALGDRSRNQGDDSIDRLDGEDEVNPPVIAFARDNRHNDSTPYDPRRTDYAVREGDFYYGVRGPALSAQPSRKLGTGPANPTGSVTAAKGWLIKRFGKGKEKSKGFEVVRSARASPMTLTGSENGTNQSPGNDIVQPYEPETPDFATQPVYGDGAVPDEEHEEFTDSEVSDVSDDDDDGIGTPRPTSQLSPLPPTLPEIHLAGPLDIGKRPSNRSNRSVKPEVPRKSSKRKSQNLSPLGGPYQYVAQPSHITNTLYDPPIHSNPSLSSAHRLPFTSSKPSTVRSSAHQNKEGGPSNSSSTSSLIPPQAPIVDEEASNTRPASMGAVHRVQVSDVTTIGVDFNLHSGSTAELITEPRRQSSASVLSIGDSIVEIHEGTAATATKPVIRRKDVPARLST